MLVYLFFTCFKELRKNRLENLLLKEKKYTTYSLLKIEGEFLISEGR